MTMSAEDFLLLRSEVSKAELDELESLVNEYPPTSFDNLAMLEVKVGMLVLGGRIHPSVADSALKWFELAFTGLMVAKDKVKPENKVEMNIMASLAVAQQRAQKSIAEYTVPDVIDSTEVRERVRIKRKKD